MNGAFAILTFLFLIALLPASFALFFTKWRGKAKRALSICTIGLITSFVAFGVTNDKDRDRAHGSKSEARVGQPADETITSGHKATGEEQYALAAASVQPDANSSHAKRASDEAQIFLSVYGPPAVDDTTAYDDPRPPIPTRFLEYQPEQVRAIFVPNARYGAPPPYTWLLMGVTDAATKKVLTLEEVDQRLIGRRTARGSSSFVTIKTFSPTMSLAVEDPAHSPIIHGKTNLPDGTEMSVAILRNESRCFVERPPGCFIAKAKTTVTTGQFTTKELWISGGYPPGMYQIFATTGPIAAQPSEVKRIVGDRAEYITGSLVKWTGPTAPSIDFAALAQLGLTRAPQ
jgi:hypothetical protein